MLTPEEARRRDILTERDKNLDKIILVYLPMLTMALLLILTFWIARYCHAHQMDPPIFHVSRRRSHFMLMGIVPISAVLLFLYPGIRFEEDRLTIKRWRIIPHKIPSLIIFGLAVWAFLRVQPRAIREEEMLQLYRRLIVAVTVAVCLCARILLYILHRNKFSPYYNKKLDRWWPDSYVFIAITVLPLAIAVLIDRHYDKIAFPYRYN